MPRIVGGTLGGRQVTAPKGRATRPTSEKVRESIFDVLANLTEIEGSVVLDLYAGSGALGIEALSRGAARAIFVESHARTAAGIRANLQQLGVSSDRWQVVVARAENWLKKPPGGPAPGLVLLDPPYAAGHAERALAAVASSPAVPAGALVVLEAAARQSPGVPPGLELLRAKRYGDTEVGFFSKVALSPEPPTPGPYP